jgi:hypothetical protein
MTTADHTVRAAIATAADPINNATLTPTLQV